MDGTPLQTSLEAPLEQKVTAGEPIINEVSEPKSESLSLQSVTNGKSVSTELRTVDAMKQDEADLLHPDRGSAEMFFLQERVASRKLSQIDALANHFAGEISPESPSKLREGLALELKALQNTDADPTKTTEISKLLRLLESLPRNADDPRSEDQIVAEIIGKAYSAASFYEIQMENADHGVSDENNTSEESSTAVSSDSEAESPSEEQSKNLGEQSEGEKQKKSRKQEVAEAAFSYFVANPDNSMQQFLDFFFSQQSAKGHAERMLKEDEKKNGLTWNKVLGERISESRDGLSHTLLEYFVDKGLIDDYSAKIDPQSSSPYLDVLLTNTDNLVVLRNALSGKPETQLEEILTKWLVQSGEDEKIYGKPSVQVTSDQAKQLVGDGFGSQLFQSLIMQL